ncbi:hypothetical protein JTE90_007578 [Oedothorax gibbosus]|uniref:Uncharacterized protein n=1 Tax=Oedothorax gibbosus TaxID=931172 RepID=A0AAV6TDT5_9ARAC|nr:hypothetical protein JTE90_007578 [Oedothorax gibbosus]
MTRRAASGKPKLLGSGGSMVAKLKLKGIDGGSPPGGTKPSIKTLWQPLSHPRSWAPTTKEANRQPTPGEGESTRRSPQRNTPAPGHRHHRPAPPPATQEETPKFRCVYKKYPKVNNILKIRAPPKAKAPPATRTNHQTTTTASSGHTGPPPKPRKSPQPAKPHRAKPGKARRVEQFINKNIYKFTNFFLTGHPTPRFTKPGAGELISNWSSITIAP